VTRARPQDRLSHGNYSGSIRLLRLIEAGLGRSFQNQTLLSAPIAFDAKPIDPSSL
jgi:hypothetical protein